MSYRTLQICLVRQARYVMLLVCIFLFSLFAVLFIKLFALLCYICLTLYKEFVYIDIMITQCMIHS